jgi:hypothetical protein
VTRNDAQDFAARLYARVPANYRAYDVEQGEPLLALLQLVGEQVANVRQDLDALWDNFFIETCQDWAVPYIGALVGANLLATPVARTNRLEVRDTVLWRRSKGTPAMLLAVAREISGWPCDLTEFFRALGWSQNVNHVRLDRPLTADLRDVHRLALLGRAGDPFAHAVDFKPSVALDGSRVTRRSLGIGRAGWATGGRYQIKNLGIFARRLQTFAIARATPAAVDPGLPVPPNAAYFTFDPLHREQPLFVEADGTALTRAAFNQSPWQYFAADIAVRQFGIALAGQPRPRDAVSQSASASAFTFAGTTGTVALDQHSGLRLASTADFRPAATHFIIEALWRRGGADTSLGALSTLLAARGDAAAFRLSTAASGTGQLVVALQTGRGALGFALPAAPAARFPGAVVAVRAARAGPPRFADVRYVYLPPAFVRPTDRLIYYVADDGSTYGAPDLGRASLRRVAEGQVHPALPPSQSATATDEFKLVGRTAGALRVADPSRLTGASVLIQADLFDGIGFHTQGAVASTNQAAAPFPELAIPNPWPAFTFGPPRNPVSGRQPDQTRLAILLRPLSGNFVPSCELIVCNRAGRSLLVYLPQIDNCPTTGMRVFVADDGSTWFAPGNLQQPLFDRPVRAATGQTLPIPGVWPLQYRRPVALDLCRAERASLLRFGELGVDPELGRFALAAGDPAIGQGGLGVDYVAAFSDRVGALDYDRLLDPTRPATRFVSQSGDADVDPLPGASKLSVHASVGAAVAAAADGDIIEIIDSATYASAGEIAVNSAAIRSLTIRAAAGERPTLTFFAASGAATGASFRLAAVAGGAAMSAFELNGVLISGGPLVIERAVAQLRLLSCTLDPRVGAALLAARSDQNDHADYLLCRCVAGAIRLGAGVGRITIADSIIDQSGGTAIAGLAAATSPPSSPPDAGAAAAGTIQLERATVLGRVHCNILNASESILDDLAVVEDQQSGCIRLSRFEAGSVLPRRYQCVPTEAQIAQVPAGRRCVAPVFNSRRFGRPDYAQLAATCPPEILSASEQESEIGAFAGALNPIRLANLRTKLQEFMPVGLVAVIVAET